MTGKSFSFCVFSSEVGTVGCIQLARELGVNIAVVLMGAYRERVLAHLAWLNVTEEPCLRCRVMHLKLLRSELVPRQRRLSRRILILYFMFITAEFSLRMLIVEHLMK